MRRQDGVIGFDCGGGDMRGGCNSERHFGLLSIIDRQPFCEQAAQAWAGASSDGMEDHEALKVIAVISDFSDFVQAEVRNIPTNRILSSCKIIRGVLLPWQHILRVEHLPVSACPDFIYHCWLQVNHHWSRNMLSRIGFPEESVVWFIAVVCGSGKGIFLGVMIICSAIGLYSMLQRKKFPASIACLNACLSDV